MKKLFLIFIGILTSLEVCSQQDSQYTQYIYNTMSVNSAYTGQRDVLSCTGLYRTQWVGIDGAPKTLTFGIHSPLKNENLGMGISIVSDQLGPIREDYINLNFSYTIRLNRSTELSFGLKGGLHNLSSDFSRGNSFQNTDVAINENISLFSPTIGVGLYLHSTRGYLGLSLPNILTTKHYDDYKGSLASESLHFFVIGGYVFNIDNDIKLKPAFLIKAVSGSPLIADLSINAMFNNRFVFGLAYRWDDSLSGLTGLQVNKTLFIGYAYDYNTSIGNKYTGGTHEVMLRFELQQINKILSPRFF